MNPVKGEIRDPLQQKPKICFFKLYENYVLFHFQHRILFLTQDVSLKMA